MKLADFKVEQWMNKYEMDAHYNLTDTCMKSLTIQELLDMEPLGSISLDYGQITGDKECKEAILSLYETGTTDQITTCHGCLEANQLVMETILEPGDHVLAFVPGYQQFIDMPRSLGCTVDTVSLDESKSWMPSITDVEQSLTENTRLIILNNPNNPTGTLYTGAFLDALIKLCRKQGIYILCDEVYRGLEANESISDLYERGIATSSLSKIYALAGLRFGWVKGPKEVIDQINVRKDYTMVSTGPLIDALALTALKHKEEILQRNRQILQTNKETIRQWLENEPRYHVQLPQEGTVCFLRYDFDIPSEQLALELLEQTGIFFVPGSCFDYEYHLRLGLGQDCQMTKEGLERLSQWTDQRLGC